MKQLFIAPIKGYQYISKMLPASCRYYPSCSEYAKWQFEFNAPHRAFGNTALRILKCNQLFDGGIDYPLVKYRPRVDKFCKKIDIIYWIVPKSVELENNYYYIIKDFDAINRTT